METKTYPALAGGSAQGATEGEEPRREALEAGTAIGRYLILASIGRGGMGHVLSAYDPELDRKVAIKVLHRREADAEEQASLLEEARAMARLCHPNVVRVYDGGTFDQRFFLAMEFLDGRTLEDWLRAEPRSWRQVAPVFRQAARGLAAAHAIGLVHRDFKPANILLDGQGAVRVGDFGLARFLNASATGREIASLAGTPGYMAPEVRAGAAAEPQSDQYSFGVALAEALYGKAAWREATAGTCPAALGSLLARFQQDATGATVPRWLQEIVSRTLAEDPDARFPGMQALLDALGRGARRRRWRWLPAAAGLATALFALLYQGQGSPAESLCAGGRERLKGIWDEDRRRSMERAFAATGVSFAQDAASKAGSALDAYTDAWVEMYGEACRATHLLGEQSEALLDLRMQCLASRLGEVKGLGEVLVAADAQVVTRATDGLQELSGLDACADTTELLYLTAPPADPRARKAIEALSTSLAELRPRLRLERTVEPGVLEAKVAAARKLGYPPLEARALVELAVSLDHRGDTEAYERTLHEALWAAIRGGDRTTAARVYVSLVGLTALDRARIDDARWWARFAEAAVAGLGEGHETLEIDLLTHQGLIELAAGRHAEARAVYRRALLQAEEALGPESTRVGTIMNDLALVSISRSIDPAVPSRLLEGTLEIRRRTFSPGNPSLAPPMVNLASLEAVSGRYEQALERVSEAARILEEFYGRHRDQAYPLGLIGEILIAMDRPREAVPSLRRAAELGEEGYGKSHPLVHGLIASLGEALLLNGQGQEAADLIDRAAALAESSLPPGHPAKIGPLRVQGKLRLTQGDPGDAAVVLERARRIYLDGDHPLDHGFLSLTVDLAEAHLALGRPDLARPLMEDLLELERPASDRHLLAAARFNLARSLETTAPGRALELAREARIGLLQGSAWTLRQGELAEAWLSRRAAPAGRGDRT